MNLLSFPLGYDSNNIEYYLFFGQRYANIKDEEERERVKNCIKVVLKFVSQRKRNWSLIFFNAIQGGNSEAMDLVTQAFNELSEDVKQFFLTLIVLYHKPGFF